MAVDTALRDHRTWLNYLQPDGLVVTPAALVDVQVTLNRNVGPLQERFLEFVRETEDEAEGTNAAIGDISELLRRFFGWPDDCLYGLDAARPVPDELHVDLPELGAVLAPALALRDPAPAEGLPAWLLLVSELPVGTDMDREERSSKAKWSASEHQRFERLLRETGVPIGLLTNRTHFRLVYAPQGESTGSVTFPVQAMTEVSGRFILAAFDLLLNSIQLLSVPPEARLPALLRRSREYQSTVSTRLAGQVLDALWDLLRGFQAADENAHRELLREVLAEDPDRVYSGLLTTLLRLVFLLYVEDRGLMPDSELYLRHYSVHQLFDRLRTDHEHYPDMMDRRYGAWAQLLAVFRAVHDGCRHPLLAIPARQGHLFDPERFLFLEGANLKNPAPPLVSDGVVYRVLDKLLVLDGDRLNYRALDVEDIGSVYQTIMGFKLELSSGTSIALRGKRKHKGEVPAPTVIDLDALVKDKPSDRTKRIRDQAGHDIIGNALASLKEANDIDGLLAALERRIDRGATPHPVPAGSMILQPTDERRKSGSHYTPRKLTEPIVRKTLEPILQRLGIKPTPEQILDLKVCDLAMGSAAFLVETCRQLANELVKAWHAHDQVPVVPADEDELLLAMRIVAQRCVYGVDRNPMAVDLAKLSLWLATLAKDHPFTFLDHNLRCGDSLVGLTNEQIAAFHWDLSAAKERVLGQDELENSIRRVTKYRAEVLQMADDNPASVLLKRAKLSAADGAANVLRQNGDLVISAFFAGKKPKERQTKRDEYLSKLLNTRKDVSIINWLSKTIAELRADPMPVRPFHWELEFPEVFGRDNPGFDAIVGNPPFMAGKNITGDLGECYLGWLRVRWQDARGQVDLVAFFFRHSYEMLRSGSAFGLIATNTIAQGDTRAGGLLAIRRAGGLIYCVVRRIPWQGAAAVMASRVHVAKRLTPTKLQIDGLEVLRITAYLSSRGPDDEPSVLNANADSSFSGYYNYGPGFLFDDTLEGATPLDEMRRIIAARPESARLVHPFVGGEDLLNTPALARNRYVIDFGTMTLDQAKKWPELLLIIEQKVKPARLRCKRERLRTHWWQFGEVRPGLRKASCGLSKFLMIPFTAKHLVVGSVPGDFYVASPHVAVTIGAWSGFAALQARPHEIWARFLSSSMRDDLRYTPSTCYETFPFPGNWESSATLEAAGKTYLAFRADLTVRNNEGLTKTYNRFHDPEEISLDTIRLRELHDEMDRAVLDAYGWTDIQPKCEFILDYVEEEDEEESGGRRRKKPWRYRWPDEIRDEVLARLLELNAKRAEEERLAAAARPPVAGDAPRRKRRKEAYDAQEELDID